MYLCTCERKLYNNQWKKITSHFECIISQIPADVNSWETQLYELKHRFTRVNAYPMLSRL